MKNCRHLLIQLIICLTLIFTIQSCVEMHSILSIGNGSDVIISLEILSNDQIEKIEFSSGGCTDIIPKKQFEIYDLIQYGIKGKGEGSVSICIFSLEDTVCTNLYVEGGYRPVLCCSYNKITTLDFTGIGY